MARKKKRRGRKRRPRFEIGDVEMMEDDPSQWPEPSEEEDLGTDVFDPEAAAGQATTDITELGSSPGPSRTARARMRMRREYPEDVAAYLAGIPEASGRESGYSYYKRMQRLKELFPEQFAGFPRAVTRQREPTGIMTRRSADEYSNWLRNKDLREAYGVPPPALYGSPQAIPREALGEVQFPGSKPRFEFGEVQFPDLTPGDQAELMTRGGRRQARR